MSISAHLPKSGHKLVVSFSHPDATPAACETDAAGIHIRVCSDVPADAVSWQRFFSHEEIHALTSKAGNTLDIQQVYDLFSTSIHSNERPVVASYADLLRFTGQPVPSSSPYFVKRYVILKGDGALFVFPLPVIGEDRPAHALAPDSPKVSPNHPIHSDSKVFSPASRRLFGDNDTLDVSRGDRIVCMSHDTAHSTVSSAAAVSQSLADAGGFGLRTAQQAGPTARNQQAGPTARNQQAGPTARKSLGFPGSIAAVPSTSASHGSQTTAIPPHSADCAVAADQEKQTLLELLGAFSASSFADLQRRNVEALREVKLLAAENMMLKKRMEATRQQRQSTPPCDRSRRVSNSRSNSLSKGTAGAGVGGGGLDTSLLSTDSIGCPSCGYVISSRQSTPVRRSVDQHDRNATRRARNIPLRSSSGRASRAAVPRQSVAPRYTTSTHLRHSKPPKAPISAHLEALARPRTRSKTPVPLATRSPTGLQRRSRDLAGPALRSYRSGSVESDRGSLLRSNSNSRGRRRSPSPVHAFQRQSRQAQPRQRQRSASNVSSVDSMIDRLRYRKEVFAASSRLAHNSFPDFETSPSSRNSQFRPRWK